jgi:neutral ceramidase
MSQRQSPVRSAELFVGAHAVDVTPRKPTFLYGYPHVERISTGVHDPLLASAMYVDDGERAVLFVSVDVIWLSKAFVASARAKICAATTLATDHVMITATHTHSGPVTLPMVSNADDPIVPAPDAEYLELLMEGVVAAALEAHRRAEPAEMTLVTTECADIGGNRHDPEGATIGEIPIVAARALGDVNRWLALMYVNRVHPTVLHEDSTLVSGDFPGMCRKYLQDELLGTDCPVLCHLGAAGNQSPRHVTRANDFAEAMRLGDLLGGAILSSLKSAEFRSDWSVAAESATTSLPTRRVPSPADAIELLGSLRRTLEDLRNQGADKRNVRTVECAVFGAEETVCLARAAARGALQSAAQACLPAEIQVIWLGKHCFVGWPGEVFAEFAQRVAGWDSSAFVITLANGELQGYVVTEEAVRENVYEASNAVFASPESGEALVRETLSLFARSSDGWDSETDLAWSSVKT